MSSIEPDCSGREVNGGEEISGGLVVARGDSAEPFEFTEEILDQVACLVEFGIESTRRCTALAERDHGGFAGGRKRLKDPLVGIESLVGDQQIGGHLRQQGIGAHQIMRLPRRQQECQRIAERIDQGMKLRAEAAAAAAKRLIRVFLWVRRRYADERGRRLRRSTCIHCRDRSPMY